MHSFLLLFELCLSHSTIEFIALVVSQQRWLENFTQPGALMCPLWNRFSYFLHIWILFAFQPSVTPSSTEQLYRGKPTGCYSLHNREAPAAAGQECLATEREAVAKLPLDNWTKMNSWKVFCFFFPSRASCFILCKGGNHTENPDLVDHIKH